MTMTELSRGRRRARIFLHAGTHANDWIGRRSLEPEGGGITVMHEKLHEQAGPSSGAFAAMDVADRHRRTVGH